MIPFSQNSDSVKYDDPPTPRGCNGYSSCPDISQIIDCNDPTLEDVKEIFTAIINDSPDDFTDPLGVAEEIFKLSASRIKAEKTCDKSDKELDEVLFDKLLISTQDTQDTQDISQDITQDIQQDIPQDTQGNTQGNTQNTQGNTQNTQGNTQGITQNIQSSITEIPDTDTEALSINSDKQSYARLLRLSEHEAPEFHAYLTEYINTDKNDFASDDGNASDFSDSDTICSDDANKDKDKDNEIEVLSEFIHSCDDQLDCSIDLK